jgi:hypothetical protein
MPPSVVRSSAHLGAGNGPLPDPGLRPTWRGLFLLVLTVLSLSAFYYFLTHRPVVPQEMNEAQLFALIKAGQVKTIVNEPDPSTGIRFLTGTYDLMVNGSVGRVAAFKVPVDLQLEPSLLSEIQQAGYKGIIETQNNRNLVFPVIINFVPLLIFGAWMCLVFVGLKRFLYKLALTFRGT